MKFVEIYKTQNDGSQTILATCKLVNNEVACEGERIFVKNLETNGVLNYQKKPKNKVFPKDGIIFLENLKFSFKTGYLNASDIK